MPINIYTEDIETGEPMSGDFIHLSETCAISKEWIKAYLLPSAYVDKDSYTMRTAYVYDAHPYDVYIPLYNEQHHIDNWLDVNDCGYDDDRDKLVSMMYEACKQGKNYYTENDFLTIWSDAFVNEYEACELYRTIVKKYFVYACVREMCEARQNCKYKWGCAKYDFEFAFEREIMNNPEGIIDC